MFTEIFQCVDFVLAWE